MARPGQLDMSHSVCDVLDIAEKIVIGILTDCILPAGRGLVTSTHRFNCGENVSFAIIIRL